MVESTDAIWYRSPRDFLTEDNAVQFFPTPDQPLATRLNATMRLAVYFSVVLAIVKRDLNVPVVVLLLVGALTYVVYEKHGQMEKQAQKKMKKLNVEERYRGKKRKVGDRVGKHLKPEVCVPPTRHNPFMNVTPVDVSDFPNRPPACKVTHKDVKKRMEHHFDHDLYRDVGDVFGRKTSSRQFYTVPNTQVPNDQQGFAEWCYKTPPTCKEGNGSQCFRNVMPRFDQ